MEEIDQFSGVGGSYKIDEKTGKRVLVERTAEAGEEKQQPVKEKPAKNLKGK